jgi:beta-galactosidase
MKAAYRTALILLLAWLPAVSAYADTGGRMVLSLDGVWQIAQGGMEAMPERFDRTVPVPGLADMAAPRFTEVGVASPQRQAFWYRREFTVAVPKAFGTVALLKVNKAQFGAKVWLNGKEAGEHSGCFTPGYFDLSGLLRYGASNTLVIRVGAYKNALPPTVPTNTDYEQVRWIPGIYDSVSLILSGTPSIASVQVAPRIASGAAVAQVVLRHAGSASVRSRLRLSVREWKTGRTASAPVAQTVEIGPGGERTIMATLRLNRPHLWTPEDPFLYILRCETGADAAETRFGMREFRYDPKTGRAMLNGRPYFLRGTNFCMFRFFEDPLRGGLPWDRAWARKLLSLPKKEFHWNAARVCIAPFPEFWYDLADELGWLLQDEFPIWGFRDEWSQEELVTEFKEWMRERWNHPSLAVWDACNETLTPRTGQLIRAVRGLDLSNRPWDDGYSPPNHPGDAVEDHPYRFISPGFRLEDLGSALDSMDGLRKPPVVINEYDWLWLNRDGTPTTLTQKLYDEKLGPNATPDQRWAFAAYNTAALTEYWRARRKAAGVEYFCCLTYSRPGGQTGDNFTDIRRLTLEPRFLKYMRDAFSPLAVMIDDFTARLAPGVPRDYRVIITNDLYTPQKGTLRLSLTSADGSQTIAEKRAPFHVKALGQTVLTLTMPLPARPGPHRLIAELVPVPPNPPHAGGEGGVRSRRNIEIVTPQEAKRLVNIALHCAATASSEIHDTRGDFPARFATDGRGSTRWSSEFADPQWLMVDLGRIRQVGRVALSWETACGKAYRIQVSGDGREWTDVYSTREGKGGREEIAFPPVTARYVRMYGAERATAFGYSLWEFQVFEE